MKIYQQIASIWAKKTNLAMSLTLLCSAQITFAESNTNTTKLIAKESTKQIIEPIRLWLNFDGKTQVILLNQQNKKIGQIYESVDGYELLQNKGLNLSRAKQNGKYGFIDETGKWVVKPTLDEAKYFSDEGLARVKQKGKWGFITPDGKFAIAPTYGYVSAFYEGLAFVRKDKEGLGYFINTNGKRAFSGDFLTASNFAKNGMAGVAFAEKPIPRYRVTPTKVTKKSIAPQIKGQAYVNKSGEIVLSNKAFAEFGEFNNFGIAEIKTIQDTSRLIDSKGNFINDISYEYLWEFSDSGLAWARYKTKDNKEVEGYIDTSGNMVWKASYHDFFEEDDGLLVNQRKGYSFYTPRGKLISENNYKWMTPFAGEEHTLALLKDKWVIVNRMGASTPIPDSIIAPLTDSEDYVLGFTDGLAPMINKNRHIVFINPQGKKQFELVPASKSAKSKMLLVNNHGKIVWKSPFVRQKTPAFLAGNVFEHFIDQTNYTEDSKGLYQSIHKLLNSQPRPYFLPNNSDNYHKNPYNVSADDISLYGTIKVLAKSYIDEGTHNLYPFLDEEYDTFETYYKILAKRISQKYGKPTHTKDYYQWKIGKKWLKLDWHNEQVDYDVFNVLTLEVNATAAKGE